MIGEVISMIANVTRNTRWPLVGILALLFVVAVAGPALAQSEGATVTKRTLGDNIAAAGTVGVVIMLLSVAGLSLVITFAMQIRRDILVPPELLGHVEGLFEEEDYDQALEVVEQQPSFLSSVLAAGLPRIDRPYHDIEASMEEAGEQEAAVLHQKIGYLSLIASVAPMLGLLGTVMGMVAAFDKIASSATSPKPAELADGISQALMTTMMGLTVAIPMSVAYFIFRNRVNNSIIEVSNIATELMDRFDHPPEH
ncbi:MAG: MotA/TolQ/ExbB proton channel family protein [Planctomycetota bacterium]|jgi:biopolymer transport protein ExbB